MLQDGQKQEIGNEIRQVFLRFGYDVENPNDIIKIQENHRWISEQREAQQKRSANRARLVWSAVAALFGAAATTAGEWLTRHSSGAP
jgi:hypothetical protein